MDDIYMNKRAFRYNKGRPMNIEQLAIGMDTSSVRVCNVSQISR